MYDWVSPDTHEHMSCACAQGEKKEKKNYIRQFCQIYLFEINFFFISFDRTQHPTQQKL